MKIGINRKTKCSRDKSCMKRPMDAFVESLKKDGAKVFNIDDPLNYPECDFIVGTGIPKVSVAKRFGRHGELDFMQKLFKTQSERGGSILVMDSGYLKRLSHIEDMNKAYYSLGFNGLNGRAKFTYKDMPSDRWDKLNIELKPWRLEGRHILYCSQYQFDASVQHVSYVKLEKNTLIKLNSYTDKKVIFRPHPKKQRIHAVDGIVLSRNLDSPIEKDFEDCHLVCVFNSNSAVEAVINGIPVLSIDEGCLVKPRGLTSENVCSPKVFDRECWKNNLAYSQWTIEEMLRGEALYHINEVLSSGVRLEYKNNIPFNLS